MNLKELVDEYRSTGVDAETSADEMETIFRACFPTAVAADEVGEIKYEFTKGTEL